MTKQLEQEGHERHRMAVHQEVLITQRLLHALGSEAAPHHNLLALVLKHEPLLVIVEILAQLSVLRGLGDSVQHLTAQIQFDKHNTDKNEYDCEQKSLSRHVKQGHVHNREEAHGDLFAR